MSSMREPMLCESNWNEFARQIDKILNGKLVLETASRGNTPSSMRDKYCMAMLGVSYFIFKLYDKKRWTDVPLDIKQEAWRLYTFALLIGNTYSRLVKTKRTDINVVKQGLNKLARTVYNSVRTRSYFSPDNREILKLSKYEFFHLNLDENDSIVLRIIARWKAILRKMKGRPQKVTITDNDIVFW